MTTLTERFDDALVFARQRHQGQFRKGTEIPYVSHLLGTAALVLEAGGDEDQAIAALLHDTLEDSDQTGVSYEELVERFGERVAGIVRDCSDSEPGAPGAEQENWQKRKKRYLKKLKSHSEDSLLVANADKLHNARAIVADYRIHGEELWARFNPEAETLWYYRSLGKIFRQRRTALSGEFDRVITQLRSLIKKRR